MLTDDKYDKNDDTSEGGSSTGSEGGKIGFVDFLNPHSAARDDLLSEKDRKHLLGVHKDVHKSKVELQKDKLTQIKNLKNGKMTLGAYRASMGGGGYGPSAFKNNPALKNYGRGIDPKVIGTPNEVDAQTNNDKREELLNDLRMRLGYQAKPMHTYTPKFKPPGG